ncbi:MAG: NCS2 family permease [Myxococcales bacterium]|nr:MAG: NCS2 family permease [Myxococcales bacterium]
MEALERIFRLKENGTTLRAEAAGGVTTFLTMAYILFVQPAVLAIAGMPMESVFLATCLSSAFATILMGIVARYPVALAPGMGENFFFVFSVALLELGGQPVGWQAALAVVFISGVLFFILSLFRVRQWILDAVPAALRHAIAAGIGLFVAEIGLLHAGIITINKTSLLPQLGSLSSPPTLLALAGLVATLALMARRVRGAILWGLLATTVFGLVGGVVQYKGIVSLPPADFSVFFAFDFAKVFTHPEFLTLIFVFLFMDVFDTLGTLVGVGAQAGLIGPDGKLPRAEKAFLCDAAGTVVGACCGMSTVTSYIESAAGVAAGARTGLANVFTGLLFLVALFFAPLVAMVGAGWQIPGSDPAAFLYPVTAPALILVGSMMVRNLTRIDWDEVGDAIPAFLTLIGIPLAFSISDGLAFGFISYPLIKLFDGKGKDVSPLVYGLGAVFVLRYIFL